LRCGHHRPMLRYATEACAFVFTTGKESRALVSPLEVPKRAALLLHARRGSSWSCRRRSCMKDTLQSGERTPPAPNNREGASFRSAVWSEAALKRERHESCRDSSGRIRALDACEHLYRHGVLGTGVAWCGICINQVNPHFGTPSGRNHVSQPCRGVSDVLLLLLRAMYEYPYTQKHITYTYTHIYRHTSSLAFGLAPTRERHV
jgi:hypothetical protein